MNQDKGQWMFWTLLGSLFCVAGCSTAPKSMECVQHQIGAIVASEIEAPFVHDPVPSPRESSFASLFARAVRHDPEYKSSGIEMEMSQLAVQQAKSSVWPRISADLTLEAPVGEGDHSSGSALGGGVFLRYDIMKAIFAEDDEAVENAKYSQVVQRRELAVKKIYYHLLNLIVSMNAEEKELAEWEASAQIATSALARVGQIQDYSEAFRKQMREWENVVAQNHADEEECRHRLAVFREELRFLTYSPEGDVSVADAARYLPDLDMVAEPVALNQDTLAMAWRRRNDARIAETYLFLAEMDVVAAKRERLPRPSAGLGVGSITLRNRNGEAPVMPFAGLSFPIFDMGDAKRKIKTAEACRELAEQKLVAFARTLLRNVREAATVQAFARDRLVASKERLALENAHLESERKLESIDRSDVLMLYSAQLAESLAKREYIHAERAYLQACLTFQELTGQEPNEDALEALREGSSDQNAAS